MGQFTLLAGHVLDLQTFATAALKHLGGNEMPVGAFFAIKLKQGLCFLFGIKTSDQSVGGPGHVGRHIFSLGGDNKRQRCGCS